MSEGDGRRPAVAGLFCRLISACPTKTIPGSRRALMLWYLVRLQVYSRLFLVTGITVTMPCPVARSIGQDTAALVQMKPHLG